VALALHCEASVRARLGFVALAGLASHACASGRGSWSADTTVADASPDATMLEASPGEVTANCGAVPPHGQQLVASPSVAVDGVTSDGYAIYTDVAAMTVNAVPIAGGPPKRIGTVDATNAVFISGDVVYFEPAVVPGVQQGLGIASLSVWRAAAGTAIVSTSILAAPASSAGTGNGFVDISADGSRLVYIETQDGLTGTLTVATTDGAARVPLVANIDLVTSGCRPFVAFAGASAVAAYCLEAPESDAGNLPPGLPDAESVPDASPPLDAAPPQEDASPAPPDAAGAPDARTAPDAAGAPDAAAGAPDAAADAGPRLDASADAGLRADASAPIDAGAPLDAGEARDAIAVADAIAPVDAGSGRDANTRNDAAADAAPPDPGRMGRGATIGEPLTTSSAPDGGALTNLATIATFTAPAFLQHVLITGTQPVFALDASGTHVLVSSPSGLVVYPIGGGAGLPIDRDGTGGTLTRDGGSVVYTTNAQALKRSPLAMPAPLTLVPSGVVGLYGLSPDESWVLTYRSQAQGGQTSDLYLASATMPDPARALSVSTSASIFGAAFTADSRYVLYFDNVSVASGVGDFVVASVSGGPPTKVTSEAFVAAATAGSQVLVTDNCTTCSGVSAGAADLRAFDAVNPATITTLVSQAFASFYLDAARDKVVYSWTCKQDRTAGVYVLPVPQ
jgi:hypothetical protein